MAEPTSLTPPNLHERIAAAARTVQLHLGPNALAMAQRGEPIRLSGGEADAVASAVLGELVDPVPAGVRVADWTAVRALQLMNEAGKERDAAQSLVRELRAQVDELTRRNAEYADRGIANGEHAERAQAALDRVRAIGPMLEGLERLLSTSSRDWGEYRVDAWLYAVLVGWDCEQDEHDDTCVHGAMEEMAGRHGWDAETVAKVRRYRAAVRALVDGTEETPRCETEFVNGARCSKPAGHRTPQKQDPHTPAQAATAVPVHACPGPDDNGISSCCGRRPYDFRGERVTRDPNKVTCPGPGATETPSMRLARTSIEAMSRESAPDQTPIREQRERPTHPDGTPYGYADMQAEGWGFCDGCRMWSTATVERPHQCAETHLNGPAAGAA